MDLAGYHGKVSSQKKRAHVCPKVWVLRGVHISNTVIPIKLNQHLVPNAMKHSAAGV